MSRRIAGITAALAFTAASATGAALAGDRITINPDGTANLGGFPVPQSGFAGVTGGGRDYWSGWREYHGFNPGDGPPEHDDTRDPDKAERIQRDIDMHLRY